MRLRHRVSKLLLRHGHVYYGGAAWTRDHSLWLQRIRFDQSGTQAAYELAPVNRFQSPSSTASANPVRVETPRRQRSLHGRGELGVGGHGRDRIVESRTTCEGDRRLRGRLEESPRPATVTSVACSWRVSARTSAWSPASTPAPSGTTNLNTTSARSYKPVGIRPQRLHHRWTIYSQRKKKHTVATTTIAR